MAYKTLVWTLDWKLKVSWFRNVFLVSSISSKKRTKTHRIVVKTNSFVWFFEEFTAWPFAFEINWPLNRPLIFQKHECSIIKYSTPLCSNGEMASSFNPPAQWTSPEWRGKQPYFSFRRGLNLQRPVSAIFSSNLSNHPKVALL